MGFYGIGSPRIPNEVTLAELSPVTTSGIDEPPIPQSHYDYQWRPKNTVFVKLGDWTSFKIIRVV